MQRALIIGSEGQDGQLLKRFLSAKSYEVWGLGKPVVAKANNLLGMDLLNDDYSMLEEFIRIQKPDEIYYVAAFHQSSQENNRATDFSFIDNSVKVNQTGFMRVLETCKTFHPKARIFYTSSSLIYSGCGSEYQHEDTMPAPRCIYSVTKCAAMAAAEFYRNTHQMFVSVGIMYNHESHLRRDYFLSKKIVNETRELMEGKREVITVGDLDAVTDWGYAPDYVKAMWHILKQAQPGNYIISSGIPHNVKDWFEVLFKHLNKDWKQFVREDKTMIVRKKPVLIGKNEKLLATGWQPEVSFDEMVIRMYNKEI